MKRRRQSLAVAALAAVLVTYAVIAFVVLAPEAVYSGDIGVKFVQARALAASGFTSLAIPYPGEVVDPQRRFFPLRPPFAMVAGGETQAIFSPIAAMLQGGAAVVAGIRGLTIVSLISAGVVLMSAMALVPAGQRPLVAVVLGLGSPLWFYASNGWEHAPAIACSTAAFALLGRPASLARVLSAGLLAGVGATLRDEVLLVLPGLLAVIWFQQRRVAPLLVVCAGTIVPLVSAGLVEVFWFGRPAAAHLRHAVHLLQSALQITGEPNPEVPVLEPLTLRGRYEVIVNYWLFGSTPDPMILVFASLIAAAWMARSLFRTGVGTCLVMALVCVSAVVDTYEVLTAPKWLAGLFHVAPYVTMALLPPPSTGRRHWWPAAILLTAAAYILIAFAGVDTSGGKSLGPRLLLPLLPLLTVGAIMRIAEHVEASSRIDRLAGWLGAAACMLAVLFHCGGTLPAYAGRNAEDAATVLEAARSPERIIVADDEFTAQLFFPLYYRKVVLLADSAEAAAALGAALEEGRFQGGALVVSRRAEPIAELHPLRMHRAQQIGRMSLRHWRR